MVKVSQLPFNLRFLDLMARMTELACSGDAIATKPQSSTERGDIYLCQRDLAYVWPDRSPDAGPVLVTPAVATCFLSTI